MATETVQAPTPSNGTAASRADALAARMAAAQPAAPVLEDSTPIDDAGDEETPTRPDRPARKVAPLPSLEDDGEVDDDSTPEGTAVEPDLERITKLERDVVRSRRAHAQQQKELAGQSAALQRQIQQLEVDRRAFAALQAKLATPEGLLEHYEMSGGSVDPLRSFIINGTDPAKKAELEARKAIEPTERKLREVEERLAAREQQERQASAYGEFRGRITELADSEHAPKVKLVARLQSMDPNYLAKRADDVADRLLKPDEFGHVKKFTYDHVILELEKELRLEARRYVDDEPAHPAVKQPANPFDDSPDEPDPVPRAKAPAKPSLSNRAASGRTVSVVPAKAGAPLSLKERIEAAERRRMGR